MNLLDAPKDFYVRIPGGKAIKPDNPCWQARLPIARGPS
jgi:hypothetical protein